MNGNQSNREPPYQVGFIPPRVNAIKRPNELTPPPQCCSSLSVWFSIQYILLLLFYFSCLLMLSTGGYFQIAYL